MTPTDTLLITVGVVLFLGMFLGVTYFASKCDALRKELRLCLELKAHCGKVENLRHRRAVKRGETIDEEA